MRAVKLSCVVSVLSLLFVVTGCSSGSSGDGDAAATKSTTVALPEVAASEFEDMTGKGAITITVKDNTFSPQYVTVSPGTKITFDNKGRNPHNVIPVEKDEFDKIPTDALQPGDQATIVIDDVGLDAYYCSLHGTATAGMTGRIQVAN